MTPERWQRIKEICQVLLDHEADERGALIKQLCAGDDELQRQVEAMLAGAVEGDSVLGRPAWELLGIPVTQRSVSTAATSTTHIPDRIGSYRILRLVGEGGMGVVYEAQQIHPHRIVALKVIKPGLANEEVLRRFQQESQALGRLQHPGIAQIYEAGTADSGFGPQPYFAMEFIRGETLTDYVNSHRLSVPQRLEIMAKICDAVDHAHQRGLIHRDLKPGNIIVDESGQPKILDFGVVRLTDSDVQASRQTDIGQLLGTLAYMSPEQVLADPLEVDTRSDVYALGVILYELLARTLPYSISRKVHEAVLTIQQEDPKRLSSISKIYRGDLDTIAAKALEKDKTRRYGSAALLASDIRHYLQDEPIAARPPSASYRLGKFVRRHRALVTGAAVVFIVLAGGIVATTREAIRARRAERAAVASEQASQAVSEFLTNDLLAQASAYAQAGPSRKPDPDLKVRTALDRAAARVGDKFANQPDIESSIRRTIGRTYRDLGLYAEAQKQLERSFELKQKLIPETHEDMLGVTDDLANVYYLQGKYDLVIPTLQRLIEIRRRMSGDEHPDTLLAMNNLGLVYSFAGKDDLAAPLLEKTLEIRRRVSGPEHAAAITIMANLSQVYHRQGKHAEAEVLGKQAIEIGRRVKGEEHPDVISSMNNLSTIYLAQAKYADAEVLLDQTLAIRRRVLGDEHPATLTTINNLGNVYIEQGRLEEAEKVFTKLLEDRKRVIGESHPNTLLTMNNLARIHRNRGDNRAAAGMLVKALEIQRRVQGPEHPATLQVMANLAAVYRLEGKYDQAKSMLETVLEARARVSGPEHPDTLFEMERLALVHQSLGQYARAEELLTKCDEARRRVLGEQHRERLNGLRALGQVFDSEGKTDQAVQAFRTSLEGYEKTGVESWERYLCQSRLGVSLAARKDYAQAEPMLVAGYDGMSRHHSAMPASERHYLDETARTLVQLYKASNKQSAAAEWDAKINGR
jgi:tetratricopeptide (TPR) repeat protein/tRNA A-37 threonylcarbamoyl transferase component Bud32